LGTFHTDFQSRNVIAPNDGSTNITPDSIGALTTEISTEIGVELNNLKTLSTNTTDMANIINLVSSAVDTTNAAWTTLSDGIQLGIDTFTTLETTIDKMKLPDFKADTAKSLAILIGFIVCGFMAWFISFFWIAMACRNNATGRCKSCCMCCGLLIMILKSFLAIIFCLLGIVFICSAGIITNMCYYQYQFYTDSSFYSSIKPNETELINLLNACMYTSSSYSMTSFFTGNALTSWNSITSIGTGLSTIEYYDTTYLTPSLTEPKTMTSYLAKLNNFKTFQLDDYTNVPTANKYTTVLATLNSAVACLSDKWVLNVVNCPTGYTVWLTSDAATLGNTSADSYCISVPEFLVAFTAANRYTSGVCGTETVANVQTYLTNLNTFFVSNESL